MYENYDNKMNGSFTFIKRIKSNETGVKDTVIRQGILQNLNGESNTKHMSGQA